MRAKRREVAARTRVGRSARRTQLSLNRFIINRKVTRESSSAVERSLSMREARGSTPRSSTTFYIFCQRIQIPLIHPKVSEGVLRSLITFTFYIWFSSSPKDSSRTQPNEIMAHHLVHSHSFSSYPHPPHPRLSSQSKPLPASTETAIYKKRQRHRVYGLLGISTFYLYFISSLSQGHLPAFAIP